MPHLYLLVAAGNLWHCLVCRFITLIYATFLSHLLFLSFSVSYKEHSLKLGPTLIQYNLIPTLTLIIPAKILFLGFYE